MTTFDDLRMWARGQRAAYVVTRDGDILPIEFAEVKHRRAEDMLGTITLDGQLAQVLAARARMRRGNIQ